MMPVCIDPNRVHEFWPHVEPFLRSAIEKTGISSFDDIARDILSGNSLVWIAWNGSKIECAASTCIQTPRDKVCIITACGGENMNRWLPLLEQIETYAREQGCKCVRIFGRKGWLRVLDGYRETNVIMDKEL